MAIDFHLLDLKRQDVADYYAQWGWDPVNELQAIFEDWWRIGHGAPTDESTRYATLTDYAFALGATTSVPTAPSTPPRTTGATTPAAPAPPGASSRPLPNLTSALAKLLGVEWSGQGDPALLATGVGTLFLLVFKFNPRN